MSDKLFNFLDNAACWLLLAGFFLTVIGAVGFADGTGTTVQVLLSGAVSTICIVIGWLIARRTETEG